MQDIIELHPSTPPAHPCSAATPPLMLIASTPHVSPADLSPLFVTCAPPLLPAPNSTPPRLPRARRKTLASVSGFNLSRRSPRLQAKKRTLPVAQMAERLLCQRMGIINEGQEVTEEAIREFVAMFNGQLPDTTVAALRALFNLDCDLAKAVEDALVEHGGEARAELQSANGEVAGEAA
ncbi:hypothetical protein CFC21_057149 [Triticum aestivum]|uniref:Uncharacterized protein n=2 Tax=Triticum aestivum TaxID=4565 RepID=A0A9R1KBW8_WHEAT|nr:hypothetical protein CFC21_057149 [Triticum aestivum]